MIRGTRWPASALVRFRHVGETARAFVWSTDRMTFRITQDGGLADVADRPADVGDDEYVRVVHPADLSSDVLLAWRRVFFDYMIVQPFDQLTRPVLKTCGRQRSFLASASEQPLDELRAELLELGYEVDPWDGEDGAHLASRVGWRGEYTLYVQLLCYRSVTNKLITVFAKKNERRVDLSTVHGVDMSEIAYDFGLAQPMTSLGRCAVHGDAGCPATLEHIPRDA